jgi:tRNA-dihydrouridine synthase
MLMGDVINLRQARKARDRKLAEQAAAEARALHGRTKGQRSMKKAEAERLAKAIEQSKLEPPSE